MKRLIILISFLIVAKFSFGQFPIVQGLGSDSTLIRVGQTYSGGVKGLLINRPFTDTSQANTYRIKNYEGAQIFTTGDSSIWVRGTGATKWIKQFGNTSGAGGDTLVWKMSGNTVGSRVATPVLGTLDGNDLNIITDGSTRLSVPSAGIVYNNSATTRYLTFDTITKQMYYNTGGSGGGITGSGAANRVTWWDGTSSVTSTSGFTFDGTNVFSIPSTGKYRIGSTQMVYLPNQSSSAFLNSIAFGDGLQNLTHSSGFEGWNNTAVGISALSANTTGFNNTATGVIALQNNTTGTLNSAFGAGALAANTTGAENAAFGQAALTSNLGGQFNSAFGANALLNNTSGQTNTAVGGDAMLINTTGIQNTVGGYRGMQNNNGNFNSGWGYRWGESMTSANGNSGIGNTALGLTTTGSFNYAAGFFAGYRNTTGSYNTYLGSNAGESVSQVANLQSSVAIGSGSYTTASYQLSFSDSINRFTAVGISRGVANYVLTDSLGTGQYWVARPNAALSLGLQDVITNDPVLTTNNTIGLGNNSLIFSGNATNSSIESVVGEYSFQATGSGRSSTFSMINDSISFKPGLGNLNIDTLNSSSNAADSMMVWNKSNGNVGIRAIPSGGITSLNGLTGATQTFAVSGQGLTISSSGTTHTFTSSDFTTASKSSDQSSTAVALENCTDLSFSADANATYEFEGKVIFTADASTTGIAFNMNGPSASFANTTFEVAVSGTGITFGNSSAFSPTAYYNTTSGNGTTPSLMIIKGLARTTASGTIQFKFMPEAGSGGTVTVKQYSILKWRKIP